MPRGFWLVSLGAITGGGLSSPYAVNKVIGYSHRLNVLGWWLPAFRLIFATLSGIAAYTIFASGVISPKIALPIINEQIGAFFLGILAGFCEHFIPSILENYGNVLKEAMIQFVKSLHGSFSNSETESQQQFPLKEDDLTSENSKNK